MSKFIIEVSGAELEVISLAIGRIPDAKPVRERKAVNLPRARSMGKPPTLNLKQKPVVEANWRRAVEGGTERWLDELAYNVVRNGLGYHNIDAVKAAWGLPR